MSLIKNNPGVLTLDTTSAQTNFNIALNIPAQTLTLVGYRVEYDTTANALADRVIYVELPIVSRNQVLDGNVGYVYLPIMLDNAVVTLRTSLRVPIYMSELLPENFIMNVRVKSGASFPLVSNMVSITLQFALEKGHLN